MPTPCWLKHLCSIRALVPMAFFLFFSFSLSGYFFGAQRPPEFTLLPGLLRPSREGTLCLHPIERVPEASMNRANPMPGALLAFYVNQGISTSFSPLLSYCWFWNTRFRSIKDPQQGRTWEKTGNVLFKPHRFRNSVTCRSEHSSKYISTKRILPLTMLYFLLRVLLFPNI